MQAELSGRVGRVAGRLQDEAKLGHERAKEVLDGLLAFTVVTLDQAGLAEKFVAYFEEVE